MDLSIIIPALNEAAKVGRDVEAAAEFLQSSGLTGEIIVVDDGSDDDTADIASAVSVPEGIDIRVIRYKERRGKGYAVRTGIRGTQGEYVMFADSGLCVPFKHALAGIDLIRSGQCGLAHASRGLRDTVIVHQKPLIRRIMSRFFRLFFIPIMGLPRTITDSQCGFKVYKGSIARDLYGDCETDGFMFDVEILLRAHRRGHEIREFPVEWTIDTDTRLKPMSEVLNSLRDLWHIRRHAR